MQGRPQSGAARHLPLGVSLLAVLTLLAAYALAQSPPYRLQRVEVVGSAHLRPEDVMAGLGLRPGDLRWRHSPARLRQRLLETEPWVRDAAVEWLGRGVLRVEVTERAPVALLPYYNLYAVLDADGVILQLAGLEEYRLPVITGIPLPRGLRGERVRHPHLPGALEAAQLLPPGARQDLSEIAVSPEGDLSLIFRGSVVAILGPPASLREKILALFATGGPERRTLLEEARLTGHNVDLRNPARPTLSPALAGPPAPGAAAGAAGPGSNSGQASGT